MRSPSRARRTSRTSRIPRTPLLASLLAGALAAGALLGLGGAGSANGAVPPAPGWSLQWSDDFNGPDRSLPNGADWQIDTGHAYPGGPGNWGTGEIQNYTSSPDNLRLDGTGNLRITPLRDGAGNWTSGRIETRRADFKAPAGGTLRIEGRIQMPNVTGDAALGYWPAFWALGSPYRGNYWNWPGIGEFDIMENVNGLNSVWGVLHCGVNPGGPCGETTGIGASRACPGATCQSAFHTYRFEWDRSTSPNELRWYVDDQLFHSVNEARVGAQTWADMTGHMRLLPAAQRGDGRGVPGRARRADPDRRDRPRAADAGRLRRGVDEGRRLDDTADHPAHDAADHSPAVRFRAAVPAHGRWRRGRDHGVDGLARLGGRRQPRRDSRPTPRSSPRGRSPGRTTAVRPSSTCSWTAGTAVANGQQVRVSYDRTGDGSWERTETYQYFATDPVPGYEHYTQARGLKSATGSHGNLVNGKVRVEVWNAIGNGPSTLGTGNQSAVRIPFG